MQRVVSIVLLAGSLALLGLPCSVSAAESPQVQASERAPEASRGPTLPLEILWPGGLCLGYISMSLKQQLRRRGHQGSDRGDAFADLISLQRPHQSDRRAATDTVAEAETPRE